jgi:hypothetical protein
LFNFSDYIIHIFLTLILFILFYLITYSGGNIKKDRSGEIIYWMFIISLIVGFNALVLQNNYIPIKIKSSEKISDFIYNKIKEEDHLLATNIKTKKNNYISNAVVKYIVKKDEINIFDVVTATNSKNYILEDNYSDIYNKCIIEYLEESETKKEMEYKKNILLKTKLIK